MKYNSTRGMAPQMNAAQAIIKGIAADGGLYVPGNLPRINESWEELSRLDYRQLAEKILAPYLTEFTPEELKSCVDGAYNGKFEAEEVVPVKEAGGAYFLELYHGPTAAFKDMALSIMPRLLTASIRKENEDKTVVILVSTSGDTGMAALKGFEDVAGTRIIVFFPDGAVSKVQEQQMKTATGSNVSVFSIKGNFDDAQTTQKQILSDKEFAAEMYADGYKFSAANSMNVGRLLPQIVYYVWGYVQLVKAGRIKAGEPVNICVPSGNFGNILAAYYAFRMGVPVGKLICASNKNRVLTDFINTGIYDANRDFYVTNAPSMDILISSNLERLLYHLSGENAEEIADLMKQLSEGRRYEVGEKIKDGLSLFAAGYAEEEQVTEAIGSLYRDCGYLMDTHTAVGYRVWKDYADRSGDNTPTLIASTASPYKFAPVVAKSIGLAEEQSAFDTIRSLNLATGIRVPAGLKDLDKKQILHDKCIERTEMKEQIKAVLSGRN